MLKAPYIAWPPQGKPRLGPIWQAVDNGQENAEQAAAPAGIGAFAMVAAAAASSGSSSSIGAEPAMVEPS